MLIKQSEGPPQWLAISRRVLLETIRDPTFVTLFLCVTVVGVVTAYRSSDQYVREVKGYVGLLDQAQAASRVAEQSGYRGIDHPDTDFDERLAISLIKPPRRGATLVRAVTQEPAYWLFTEIGLIEGPSLQELGMAETGGTTDQSDLLDVGAQMGGLVLLVLGSLSLPREREQRTMEMLAGMGASRRQIIAGHLAAGAGFAGALVILLLSITALVVWAVGSFGGFHELATITLVGLGLFALLFWYYCLGAWISSFAVDVRSGVAFSIAIWAVVAIALPGLLMLATQRVAENASKEQPYLASETSLAAEEELALALGQAFRDVTDAAPNTISTKGIMDNWEEIRLQASSEWRNYYSGRGAAIEAALDRRRRIEEKSYSLARLLSWASPPTLLRYFAADMAGVGWGTRQNWSRAADQRQRQVYERVLAEPITVPIKNGVAEMRVAVRQPPRLEELSIQAPMLQAGAISGMGRSFIEFIGLTMISVLFALAVSRRYARV